MAKEENVIIKNAKDLLNIFNKEISVPTEDEAVPGFGTQLEYFRKDTSKFDFLVCGQDITIPERVIEPINTTGAGGKVEDNSGTLWDTYQPGNRGVLQTVTYTFIFTTASKAKLQPLINTVQTYRIILKNDTQDFWLLQGIITNVSLVANASATEKVMYNITIQPSGFILAGQLKQQV